MITLISVNKTYTKGAHQIVASNNISCHINEGEFVAVVGKSGSGKSTLLNLLAGLDTASSGKILFDGTDISSFNANQYAAHRLHNIGIIFQSFNLIFSKTALENVMLPLIFAGYSKSERLEKAKRALEQVGLGDRMQHKANELSGGEAQRVAIARALVNDPKVLLADEPTGNLDSTTTMEILQILQTLKAKGKTIIMITHDQEIAGQVADRILTIKDGLLSE
ncbi:ABC transporter ATP-binding protein [Taibaiella sp. KBW10]|uniref:ABC transporter ATP-binding protein n=1 Tax=Taibaiella sp. KBW10 TaxID=2153357 RepID=UPI000F5B6114|nr:ABC transporter ATP-binding protein [Taibaiella sp. KBW10]RQO32580.1 ABC transporter ATP-binding protein [Taibaiella sp. KBW10]